MLCIAFAVAGWRLWLIDSSSFETRLWLAILILSWWYNPIFFVARAPMAALVVIGLLAVLMLIFVVRTWTADRISSLLFVPCLAWVVYATMLTAWVIQLNPGI
jgi:tryptophan-rich sensory protein